MNRKGKSTLALASLLLFSALVSGVWGLTSLASADESADSTFVASLVLNEADANNVSTVIDGKVMLNQDAFFTKEEDFVMEVAAEPEVIEKPVVKAFDAFTPTNYSVDDFNKFLEITTLKGMGEIFVKLEREHNVNGVFALAILCNESGYGKYRANTNNYFGMRTNRGYMSFESIEANVMYFGELMHKNWYAGKSMEQIAKVYCPPTYQSWLSTVTNLMNKFYNMI